MKTLLKLTLVIMAMMAAATATAKDDAVSELIQKALDSHSLTMEITYVSPTSMAGFPSIDGYRICIRDGKLKADLPYFGRAETALFGDDEAGLRFDDCEIEIKENYKKAKKGVYVWNFKARTTSDERVDVNLTFYDNGTVQVRCNCTKRTGISYYGSMVEPDATEQ
ncbi:MAG: DUF4251 domain-containing protein [Bacteroidales bacterium]|nr:DUF4251 domain-containing protein [Bacteroidales bacterium]